MVLPLYSALEKLDGTLLEAASDSAARRGKLLAHHLPALHSGRDRRRNDLLHSDYRRIRHPRSSRRSEHADDRQDALDRVFGNRDWPLASAVAVVLLLLLVVPIMIFQNQQQKA